MADADPNVTLDLQEQIARIAKAQAETGKFAVERRKLAAEASKFHVERFTIALAVLVNLLSGAAGGAIVAYVLMHR
jgi:hypothetical protein